MAQSSLKRFFGATVVGSEVRPAKRLLSSMSSTATTSSGAESNAEHAPAADSSQTTTSIQVNADTIENKRIIALERKAAAEVANFADLDAAMPSCWGEQLKAVLVKPFWQQLKQTLQEQQSSGKVIFPPPNKVFSALHLTRLPDVRAVIVGQDP